MDIEINQEVVFVFDLDDTLYYELDYLISAYKEIISKSKAHMQSDLVLNQILKKFIAGENVFEWLIKSNFFIDTIKLEDLLTWYRSHKPVIRLRDGALCLFEKIKEKKGKIGLLTDGRSITQRNKIEGLKINNFLDKIVISEEIGSEKPSIQNFSAFKEMGNSFIYLGDNISKDFITPKQLGWRTICINGDSKKIYKNDGVFSANQLPKYYINEFSDINII